MAHAVWVAEHCRRVGVFVGTGSRGALKEWQAPPFTSSSSSPLSYFTAAAITLFLCWCEGWFKEETGRSAASRHSTSRYN